MTQALFDPDDLRAELERARRDLIDGTADLVKAVRAHATDPLLVEIADQADRALSLERSLRRLLALEIAG